MAVGLTAAAADRVDAYLETSSEANVGLYRRCGWEVVRHTQVGALPIWIMRHAGGTEQDRSPMFIQ